MIDKARHDYMELPYLYGAAVVLVLFLSILSVSIDTSRFGIVLPFKEEEKADMYNPAAFAQIDLEARAYVVYDLVDKKVIASKNADEVLPLASITKIMTAFTALNHADRNTKITITENAIDEGVDLGIDVGQVWELDELIKYTLVFSSNDGAYAVAQSLKGEADFIAQMNTDSTLLGLGLTFTDPAGLDIDGNLGGRGTALDVAKLFGVVRRMYPEILEATAKTRVNVLASKERVTGIPNTNQEIADFFGAEASKTGYTDIAGGNLGVVVDISLGRPVVIVVLGSTREGRFSDIQMLYDALVKGVN